MFGWLLPIYLPDLTWRQRAIMFRSRTLMRLAQHRGFIPVSACTRCCYPPSLLVGEGQITAKEKKKKSSLDLLTSFVRIHRSERGF